MCNDLGTAPAFRATIILSVEASSWPELSKLRYEVGIRWFVRRSVLEIANDSRFPRRSIAYALCFLGTHARLLPVNVSFSDVRPRSVDSKHLCSHVLCCGLCCGDHPMYCTCPFSLFRKTKLLPFDLRPMVLVTGRPTLSTGVRAGSDG